MCPRILGSGGCACAAALGLTVWRYAQVQLFRKTIGGPLGEEALYCSAPSGSCILLPLGGVEWRVGGGRVAFSQMVLQQLDIHREKKNLDLQFTPYTKIRIKWIIYLNVKHKPIQFLEKQKKSFGTQDYVKSFCTWHKKPNP